MEYCHLMKNSKYQQLYGQSYAKEIDRLAQGMPGKVTGTNNISFINKSSVPANWWRNVTYGRIVVATPKGDSYAPATTKGGQSATSKGGPTCYA